MILRNYLKQYDENPIFLSLMSTIQIRVMSLSVTGIEHRKIEPITKHLSHCKKNQSSWPTKIDRSERNTNLPNHAYKNSEETQIIFVDKLIINPQFIGSRQTHRKKSITSNRSPRTSRRTLN